MVSDDTRSRGQILLVGAIALAFIVLGLTAIYNAQLTARPTTTGSVGQPADEAKEYDREVRRNTRGVVVRTNHRPDYYADAPDANATIRREMHNYSDLLSRTYADGTGRVTNVTYERPVRMGTRVTQYDNATLTDDTGNEDWEPLGPPPAAPPGTPDKGDIGWFVLNLNVTSMNETEPFEVVVVNGTDPPGPVDNTNETTYTFTRNSTGTTLIDAEAETTANIPTNNATACNPRGNRSVIDLEEGRSFTSGCTFFPPLDLLNPPYTVEFRNGDETVGKFDLVTNYSWSGAGPLPGPDANSLDECPESDDPCNTPAAWNVTITTRYQSGKISYVNTQNVTVYEGV